MQRCEKDKMGHPGNSKGEECKPDITEFSKVVQAVSETLQKNKEILGGGMT